MPVYCSDTTPPPKEAPQEAVVKDSLTTESAQPEPKKPEPCRDADLPAVAGGWQSL